jgi:site-specific recombinase XerD
MINLQEYLQQRHPPATVKSYHREITIYLQKHPKAAKYNYKEVMGYISELRSRYSNAGNVSRIVQALKKYYQYLHTSGQRKDNPAKAIRLRDNKAKPLQLQELFTTAELQTLLQPKKERYPFLMDRNKVMMSLLVNQGLKLGELAGLDIHHISLADGTIFVPGSGNTNKRTLQLKAEQVMLLHGYIHEARPKLVTARTANSPKLLLSKLGQPLSIADIQYLVETFGSLYPERHLTPQTIRMSVIMNLLNAGNDIRVVQVFAGHKRPDATEKYKQSHIEALKTEIQKHHPLG